MVAVLGTHSACLFDCEITAISALLPHPLPLSRRSPLNVLHRVTELPHWKLALHYPLTRTHFDIILFVKRAVYGFIGWCAYRLGDVDVALIYLYGPVARLGITIQWTPKAR